MGVENESNLTGIKKHVFQAITNGQNQTAQVSQMIELGSLLSASTSTSTSTDSSLDDELSSMLSGLKKQMRVMNTMNTITMGLNAVSSVLGALAGPASMQAAVSAAAGGGTSAEPTLSKLDLKCSEKKLSSQIDERRTYISSMDSKISGYEAEINSKSQSKANLEADNADRISKKTGYQTAVDTKTEEYNNAVKAWNDASAELSTLSGSGAGSVTEAQTAKASAQSEYNRLNSATPKDNAAIEAAKKKLDAAEAELTKRQERKTLLGGNDADKSVNGLKAKMSAAEAAKKQAIQENADNLAKIEDNEKQIATLKSEIDKLNQDKQSAQTKRSNANNELTQLRQALEGKQKK